jgi:hypothetical protein
MYQKRDCTNNWELLLTMYGYCLQLKPERPPPNTIDSEGKSGKGQNRIVRHLFSEFLSRITRRFKSSV